MAKAYLTKDNFKDKLDASKSWMSPLFEPIGEYERISRNRPHPGIDKNYPKTTDGTLAAIIAEAGKRIVQQIPSGEVKTNKGQVYDIVAGYVLEKEIIPYAVTQADVLQKSWGVISKGLSFGSCKTMSFINKDGKADFRLIYVKNGYDEPGKSTFYEENFYFIQAWYQQSDIDDIIDAENARQKEAKNNGDKYTPEWDVAALEQTKDWLTTKSSNDQSAAEIEKNMRSEAIEIFHGVQNGVGAPTLSYATGPGIFVKEAPNKDPRGVFNIQNFYCDIDFENPLGRGLVERSGGKQNVIDSMLQSYSYSRALSLAPPLIKKGTYNKTTLRLTPNAVWDLGTEQTNTVETAKLDTTALNNFSNDYGLFKSQIIAENNNGDTSVSSDVGNPGFSKTTAGVQAQQLKLGISDNYLRKQYESWYGDVCESLLNLHFANNFGVEPIELDAQTAAAIRKIDPMLVNEDDIYMLDYDEFDDAIKFTVDASTSDKASKKEQLDALDGLMQRIADNPLLAQLYQQYPDKLVEIANKYTELSGVEDQERLTIDMDQFKKDQEEQKAMQAQQMAAQQQPQLSQGDMAAQTPQPQEQPQDTPPTDPTQQPMDDQSQQLDLPSPEERKQLITELADRGFSDDDVERADAMFSEGYPLEAIVEMLQQPEGAAHE